MPTMTVWNPEKSMRHQDCPGNPSETHIPYLALAQRRADSSPTVLTRSMNRLRSCSVIAGMRASDVFAEGFQGIPPLIQLVEAYL